jgi:hypothetical protein
MAVIYRKTPKGTDEIATRANRLAPRLRTALILVDGIRDDAQLGKLITQQPLETLQELLAHGYIEVSPAPEPAVKPARVNTAQAGHGYDDKAAFATYRAQAVRAFNDLAGPTGENLAIKMEKAASREQLAPLLQIAHGIILNAHGSTVANEFKARFATF